MNVISLVLINILEKKTLWCICIPVDNGKKCLLNFNVFQFVWIFIIKEPK